MKNTQLPQTIISKDYCKNQQIVFDICQVKGQIALKDPQNNELQIINKFGQIVKQAPFQEQVLQILFSPCSYYLSIITEKQLYITKTQKKELHFDQIDLEGLSPCIQNWSKNSVLAVGTKTGEIIFYYPQNSKKILTVGKHSNQITNLDWNENKLLISSSKKEKITISKEDSQTDNSTQFQGINLQIDVSLLKWINIKKVKSKNKSSVILDRLKSNDVFICVTSDRKSLLIFDIKDNQKPLKTEFNLNYGKIIDFHYLQTGDIVIAFSKGYLIKVSLLNDSLQEEVDNEKIFINHLSQLVVQENNDKIYVLGDQQLRVLNIRKFKELREYHKKLESSNQYLQMSHNGQIGVLVDNKSLLELLMFYYDTQPKMNEQYLILQTSCSELQIFSYDQKKLELFPSNNINDEGFEIQGYEINRDMIIIHFENTYKLYEIKQQIECIKQGELKNDIQLVLNNSENFLVFTKNQMQIINKNNEQYIDITQNMNFEKEKIYVDDNFIYTIENDLFIIYDIHNFKELYRTKLDTNIKKMFYNQYNHYFILQTTENNIKYFKPQEHLNITIENFQLEIEQVFFNNNVSNNFCILDNQNKVYTCLVDQKNYKENIQIQLVLESIDYDQYKDRSGQICQTYIQKEFTPMLFNNGYFVCLTKEQNLHKQYLSSHSFLMDLQDDNKQQSKSDLGSDNSLQILEDTLEQQFFQSLELKQFDVAYIIQSKIKNKKQILQNLAQESLQHFDFETAKKCYQKLNQYKMVNLIDLIENKNNLMEQKGYIAAIAEEYEIAKQNFLNSQKPEIAIQLLLQNHNYIEALQISQQYQLKDQAAEINLQQAQSELTQENFIKAISFYESALKQTNDSQIQQRAYLGQIKVSLEQKNTLKIQQLLNQIKQKEHFEEIAEICYKNELYDIGVQIYKKIENTEKIIEGLLNICRTDQSRKEELSQFLQNNLEQIQDNSLLLKLGKYFEKTEDKKLAEKVYIQSRDNIAQIKFYLFSMQDHIKAEQIFQSQCNKSQTAASHLADYFIQIDKNKKKAIQYYILAGKRIEAFNRARNEQLIDVYCQYVDKVDQKEALVIAQYYEDIKEYCKSGKYYEKCNQLEKSLVNYIKGKDYQAAIDLVMKLKSEELFEFLVQIFAGNTSIYEDEEIDNMEIVEPIF